MHWIGAVEQKDIININMVKARVSGTTAMNLRIEMD